MRRRHSSRLPTWRPPAPHRSGRRITRSLKVSSRSATKRQSVVAVAVGADGPSVHRTRTGCFLLGRSCSRRRSMSCGPRICGDFLAKPTVGSDLVSSWRGGAGRRVMTAHRSPTRSRSGCLAGRCSSHPRRSRCCPPSSTATRSSPRTAVSGPPRSPLRSSSRLSRSCSPSTSGSGWCSPSTPSTPSAPWSCGACANPNGPHRCR